MRSVCRNSTYKRKKSSWISKNISHNRHITIMKEVRQNYCKPARLLNRQLLNFYAYISQLVTLRNSDGRFI